MSYDTQSGKNNEDPMFKNLSMSEAYKVSHLSKLPYSYTHGNYTIETNAFRALRRVIKKL